MPIRYTSTAKYKGRRKKRQRSSALVSRVRKLEKKTSGMEYKFKDFTVAKTAIATTPTSQNLCLIAQGDDHDERNGDSITVTGVYVNCWISTDTAGDNNVMRLMLIQDKQCNGVGGSIGEVLSAGGATTAIFSPLELDNKHRFRMLWDKTVEVNDAGRSNVIFSKYIPLNLKIRYDGTTGVIADQKSNNIFFAFGGVSNLGDIQINSRVRYLDA